MVAEKQFRNPTEYGAPKKKTTTWTSTGAASMLLTNKKGKIKLGRTYAAMRHVQVFYFDNKIQVYFMLNSVKIRGKTTNHITLQNRLKPVGWALLFAWQVPLSRLRG